MHEGLRVGLERDPAARLATVTLRLGRGNILSVEALAALAERVAEALAAPPPVALVLAAEGPHFGYGASVEDHLPGRVEAMLTGMRRAVTALARAPAFTIACVRGACLGGSLEVALACDRIVAHPDASFGQPEVALGVIAPIASALLGLRVGEARAADLLATGRRVDATAALGAGLCDALEEDPEASARAFVNTHLAGHSASALAFALRAARRARVRALEQDLPAIEALYRDEVMQSPDALEGLRAFLDKRPPRFGPR